MRSALGEIISWFNGYLAIVLRSYASFYYSIIFSSLALLSYMTFDTWILSACLIEHLLGTLVMHPFDPLS